MTDTAWTYFFALHGGRQAPFIEPEIGRFQRPDKTGSCQILGRDGRWRASSFLAKVADGSLTGFTIEDRPSSERIGELIGKLYLGGFYAAVPEEFPTPPPRPAEPSWFYVVLASWGGGAVPFAPLDGQEFAYWLAEELPRMARGHSRLTYEQITIGRSNRHDYDLNFQELTRDGEWAEARWDDPRYTFPPDHVGVEITDQLAQLLISYGQQSGYFRALPTEFPDPAHQSGWAAMVSDDDLAGHARPHRFLTGGPQS